VIRFLLSLLAFADVDALLPFVLLCHFPNVDRSVDGKRIMCIFAWSHVNNGKTKKIPNR